MGEDLGSFCPASFPYLAHCEATPKLGLDCLIATAGLEVPEVKCCLNCPCLKEICMQPEPKAREYPAAAPKLFAMGWLSAWLCYGKNDTVKI